MQRLNEDIKQKNFRQIYLLCGEEAYLRKQCRDRLKQALCAPDDTMNYRYLEGKDPNVGAIIDLAQTVPFFAERRLIVVENSGLFKSGGEALADYLKDPAPTAFFVFVETEVDKRSKLYKTVREKGAVVECAPQKLPELRLWIAGLLKKENKKITQQTLDLFLEKTGTDMANIRMELEKLICYLGQRDVVTQEDVQAICTDRLSNRIFDMVDAIADGKKQLALALYDDLLALKEPPMRILFLIARQFNLLLQVKELRSRRCDNKTIAEKTGLRDFLVGRYAAQAARFSAERLREAVEACVEAEEAVKTGRMPDRLSVELLIIRYSTRQERA